MIIETSALVEMFSGGQRSEDLAAKILNAKAPKVGAVTVLETAAILRRQKGRGAVDRFLEFLVVQKISIVPFDGDQLLSSLLGDAAYGDGSENGEASGTNLRLAELTTYGLSKHLDEPLLHCNVNMRRTDLDDA